MLLKCARLLLSAVLWQALCSQCVQIGSGLASEGHLKTFQLGSWSRVSSLLQTHPWTMLQNSATARGPAGEGPGPRQGLAARAGLGEHVRLISVTCGRAWPVVCGQAGWTVSPGRSPPVLLPQEICPPPPPPPLRLSSLSLARSLRRTGTAKAKPQALGQRSPLRSESKVNSLRETRFIFVFPLISGLEMEKCASVCSEGRLDSLHRATLWHWGSHSVQKINYFVKLPLN